MDIDPVHMKDFSYYKECFSTLHTAKSNGFFAPHKPLLLLSVIDLVERGVIRSNHIELSDDLVATFKSNTAKYIGHSIVFSPNIGKPFYHMQHEPFWHLVPAEYSTELDIAADSQIGYGKKSVSYAISTLRANYRYAMIDIELFELLQNEDARARLRVMLISKYFSSQPSAIAPISLLPACISILTLIA
jgi:putative restriction endonuclease